LESLLASVRTNPQTVSQPALAAALKARFSLTRSHSSVAAELAGFIHGFCDAAVAPHMCRTLREQSPENHDWLCPCQHGEHFGVDLCWSWVGFLQSHVGPPNPFHSQYGTEPPYSCPSGTPGKRILFNGHLVR